jgi:ankyrin repeat protein
MRRTLGVSFSALSMLALAGAVWIAQPPRLAHASEHGSAAARALGRQLVEALMDNRIAEASELIDAGAEVNYYSEGDGSPLVIAARRGSMPMVQLLLAHGANVDQPAPGDGNPLIMAAAHGHLDIVMLLVEGGADVNAVVDADETPLINAARRNRLDVARYLIDHGADVNLAVIAPTVDGSQRRSPLGMALRGGHEEMARLLRERGATA